MKRPYSWREIFKNWPKYTICIISNEFCERFSYMGMRAVLTLYLINILKFRSTTSTIFFTLFNIIGSLTPLFGSVLADGTIFYVSIIYWFGQIMLTFGSSENPDSGVHPLLDMLGLTVIAVGMGGIKPCVMPFGADQFKSDQVYMQTLFISVFYFTINVGALFAAIITPIFRTWSCLGEDNCYPLAFGIPMILMFLSIATLYLPIPMFWALYDQQGSVWIIQGLQMDCRLWGNALLLPDQVQSINMLLIIIFIPILQGIIYPTVEKFVRLTILRKMVFGGYLAVLSFVIAGIVQFNVNKSLPNLPSSSQTYVSFTNGFENCNLTISLTDNPSIFRKLLPNSSLENLNHDTIHTFTLSRNFASFDIEYENNSKNSDCNGINLPKYINYTIKSGKIYNIYMGSNGAFMSEAKTSKPTEGNGEFKLAISLALSDFSYQGNLAICRKNTKGTTEEHPCDPRWPSDFYYYETNYNNGRDNDLDSTQNYTLSSSNFSTPENYATIYSFKSIRPGQWRLFYMKETAKSAGRKTLSKYDIHVTDSQIEFEIEKEGGVYVMFVHGIKNNSTFSLFQVVPDNSVSILWQLPQYTVVTFAEMLFAISAQEFAYTQAPRSMKSVVFSLYLFTVAIGDCIIIAIAALDLFKNLAIQNLVYAAGMFIVISIFMVLSIFYKYKNYDEREEEISIEETYNNREIEKL